MQSRLWCFHQPLILQGLLALEGCRHFLLAPWFLTRNLSCRFPYRWNVLSHCFQDSVFVFTFRSFTTTCLGVDCFGFILFVVSSASWTSESVFYQITAVSAMTPLISFSAPPHPVSSPSRTLRTQMSEICSSPTGGGEHTLLPGGGADSPLASAATWLGGGPPLPCWTRLAFWPPKWPSDTRGGMWVTLLLSEGRIPGSQHGLHGHRRSTRGSSGIKPQLLTQPSLRWVLAPTQSLLVEAAAGPQVFQSHLVGTEQVL